MTLPRGAGDVLSDHVQFEVESIDRLYCNLYVPQLQRAEGIVGFIRGHLGQPIASTAVIAPMSRDFTTRLRSFADDRGIPRIDFARGQRKDDVMHERLARFTAAGRTEGVLFIGRAQEKNTVFRTGKRRAADGRAYPWIVRTTSVANQFYVHCVDEDFGAFFLRFSSCFPYGGKLLINGHHFAQAQAARAGIGFAALDNGFAAVDDVAAVQAICGSLTEDKIEALARKWLAILPGPYSPEDLAAGYRYDISVLQAEFSLTQVLDRPLAGRVFLDQVIHDNLGIGRPDQIGLIFGRRIVRKGPRATPGRFRTRVITSDVTPSLHVDYKSSKIKQYHKLGKAIRTETTINDTRDFGIGKRLTNLPALRQAGFTASRRLLAAQALSHDPITGASALARVTDPVITETGTRVAGLRLTDPRSLALLSVLCVFRLLPHGFTNAGLRRHLAPLPGKEPGHMTSGQITYDLRRLRLHGLIERVPRTFRYQVTDAGMRSAQFLTRVHDRVLRTGLAEITDPSPPAPTALRAADRAYQAALDDLTRQAARPPEHPASARRQGDDPRAPDLTQNSRPNPPAPVAFKGRLVQYAGRILRSHPGKATAEIHDYHDLHTGVLAASLAKRALGRYLDLPGGDMTVLHPGGPPALPRPACTPAAIRTVLAANADADTLRRYDSDLDAAFEQARAGGDLTPLLETVRRWWFEADAWRDPASRRDYEARVTRYLTSGPPPPARRVSRAQIRERYGV